MNFYNLAAFYNLLFGLAVIYILNDIIIHFVLITTHTQGLHVISSRSWHKRDNSRSHQQVIKMARYSVLFGAYVFIYFVLNVSVIICVYLLVSATGPDLSHGSVWVANAPGVPYIVIKDISSMICAYLSFEWNHRWYEHICCVCDKRCKRRIERFQNKAIQKGLNKKYANIHFVNGDDKLLSDCVQVQKKYGPGIKDSHIHFVNGNDEVLLGDGVHVQRNPLLSDIMNNEDEINMVNDAPHIFI